jgi:hypothetical protein
MRKTYLLIIAALVMSACGGLGIELKPAVTPTPSPDVEATVAAQVAATLAAQPPSATPGAAQASPTSAPINTPLPSSSGGLSFTIAQNNTHLAHECGLNGEVFIDGNGNTITLSGECLTVALNGSSNTVMIEAVASILLNGDGNQVIWQRALTGSSPTVVRLGANNTVAQGSVDVGNAPTATQVVVQASPTPAPQGGGTIVITETSLDQTYDCTGQTVQIIGGANDITLVGACNRLEIPGGSNTVVASSVAEVFISGATNVVSLDAAGSITIVGASNALTWRRGLNGDQPAITNVGFDNIVRQAP